MPYGKHQVLFTVILGYLVLFIPVLLRPQVGNSSKIKQSLPVNLITYTYSFASGGYLLPQFLFHYETLLPAPEVSWGWNLTFQHDSWDKWLMAATDICKYL